MLYRFSVAVTVLATALLATAPGARAHDESKYPDWSGQWRRVEGGPPRYDHSKPYGRGQDVPLTEEYRLIHEASLADQASGGQRIYDQSGIPFHEDGEGLIRERIYLDKNDLNILHNEMTTIDHALTRPWTVTRNYRREKKVIWTENNCVEGNDNIAIGKEDYLLSPDGFLMPVKKGQKPPDLKYFNQN